MEIDFADDGEPAIRYEFPIRVGSDGRFNRRLGPKPTINGTWPLVITAWDDAGNQGRTVCRPGVHVTP